MSKTIQKKQNDGPAVLRFEARLLRRPGLARSGSGLMIGIPADIAALLAGMTRVEGTLNGHPFRAPLEADLSGGLSLRVNKAMLKGSGAAEGEMVALAMLGPEGDVTLPEDLRASLEASEPAQSLWEDLSPLGRRDWLRWIEAARTAETRVRRVRRSVEQLSEGKRRPCCVNLNEFMLCRIQESEQSEAL